MRTSSLLLALVAAGAQLGSLMTVRVGGCSPEKSRRVRLLKIRNDLAALQNAAMAFEALTDRWPDTVEDLVSDIPGALQKTPRDPWANSYGMIPTPAGPIFYSLGRDAAYGGTGPDADVSSPEDADISACRSGTIR